MRARDALSIVIVGVAATTVYAQGAVYKCTDASGKVTYQDGVCKNSITQSTLEIAPPESPAAAPMRPPVARTPSAPPPSGVSVAEPIDIDPYGPRDTWQQLGDALKRGDREAALGELTPQLRERFAPRFDLLLGTDNSFDIAQLGVIQSVTLISSSLASLTLTRARAGGTFGYSVLMLRTADGKWLIDEM